MTDKEYSPPPKIIKKKSLDGLDQLKPSISTENNSEDESKKDE
ncbi:MAG: hypothetical protein ACRBCT_01650 [Alphaproteobacteria bacterium]